MDTSRRGFLAAAGATAVSLAGCLGGGGNEAGNCQISDEPRVQELSAPVAGDPNADITVMVFEDFLCPHCATFSLQIAPQIRSEYVEPGIIRFEHRDLPLPIDEKWSWAVPSAARGVQDAMGDEAFFEYKHALFEEYQDAGEYTMDVLDSLADDVGADGCAIRGDAINETYRPVLKADRQRGINMGAQGTPAVFVNGRLLESPAFSNIRSAIEAER